MQNELSIDIEKLLQDSDQESSVLISDRDRFSSAGGFSIREDDYRERALKKLREIDGLNNEKAMSQRLSDIIKDLNM
jgi:hypothetical protein